MLVIIFSNPRTYFKSETTLGLMQRGGTETRVRIMSSGLLALAFISSRGMSSSVIRLNRSRTSIGFNMWIRPVVDTMEDNSLLSSMASSYSANFSVTNSLVFFWLRNFSWLIFRRPHFLTVPLMSLQ